MVKEIIAQVFENVIKISYSANHADRLGFQPVETPGGRGFAGIVHD